MPTVATYNILHGYYKDQILGNITLLIQKGADIICLQEADLPFEEHLNNFLQVNNLKAWQVRYIHLGSGCNLAILWDSTKAKFLNSMTIQLPITPGSCCQRGALAGRFLVGDREIRITTAHLSWEGGMNHRFVQLKHLKEVLAKNPCDREVLCGDFNTSVPAAFRNYQKKKVMNILSNGWANALPDLVWTCDVSHSYPKDRFHLISVTLKSLGIKLRSCLDYMLAKNLSVVSGEMLDVPGSDHRPLLVKLDVQYT